MIGIPYWMEKTRSAVPGGQPRVGEHTDAVLDALEATT